MQFFLHTISRIRIVNGTDEFECTPARFAELEPDYPDLPVLAVARYWTPENAYLEGLIEYDGHECGQYCDRVGNYTQYPVIYADVSLSVESLCICEAGASIVVTASLQDDESTILPITQAWPIRLTHEFEGDIDRILFSFVAGECTANYIANPVMPLGVWRIDESRFDLVEFGGQSYQVRLVRPVEFVTYRTI